MKSRLVAYLTASNSCCILCLHSGFICSTYGMSYGDKVTCGDDASAQLLAEVWQDHLLSLLIGAGARMPDEAGGSLQAKSKKDHHAKRKSKKHERAPKKPEGPVGESKEPKRVVKPRRKELEQVIEPNARRGTLRGAAQPEGVAVPCIRHLI